MSFKGEEHLNHLWWCSSLWPEFHGLSIFPFSLLPKKKKKHPRVYFSFALFISRLSPLKASLHELPQEITSTNISKMKQLKSRRKLFQGGIRSSFLLKVSLVGLKMQWYRQHLFFPPGNVRCRMCHTSMYTQTLGWHVLDMRLVGGLAAGESVVWGFYRSRWCWLEPDATQDSSICISPHAAPLSLSDTITEEPSPLTRPGSSSLGRVSL